MAAERKFVAENIRRVLLKEYLMKEVSRAGFGGLDVQRTPMGTRVILTTERPGLVIGRRGQTIKNLTAVIEDRFGQEPDRSHRGPLRLREPPDRGSGSRERLP